MTVRRLVPLAALLVTAGLVLAQPPAKTSDPEPKKGAPTSKEPARPAPGSLEDTLEKALRNSADIKAAEAKVRDAEAELNRVRQQVLTKATALHVDLNLARRMLGVAEQTLANLERMVKQGMVSAGETLAAQAMVEKHRGEVEKLETELKSLRGEFALPGHAGIVRSVAFSPDGRVIAGTAPDGQVRIWDAITGWEVKYLDRAAGQLQGQSASGVQTPMAERVRKFLETEVSFEELLGAVKGDFSLGQMTNALLRLTKSDIPVYKTHPVGEARWMVDLDAKGKMPVAALLQLVEDHSPDLRIVVREYGLLMTTADRVPDGAVRVVDFWKGKSPEPKADPKGPGKK